VLLDQTQPLIIVLIDHTTFILQMSSR